MNYKKVDKIHNPFYKSQINDNEMIINLGIKFNIGSRFMIFDRDYDIGKKNVGGRDGTHHSLSVAMYLWLLGLSK
jgi:hypothetical protein